MGNLLFFITVNSIAGFHSLIAKQNSSLSYPINYYIFERIKPESEKYCLDSMDDDGVLYRAVADHPASVPKWK